MSVTFGAPPSSVPFAGGTKRYEFRGATLDAPDDWTEESLFRLEAPGPPPQPSITLVKSGVPPEVTLELYAARRIAEISKLVAALDVVESKEAYFGSLPGYQIRLAWEELPGRVMQRAIMTRTHDGVFILSLNCFEQQAMRAELVFDRVAASFRAPAGRST